MRNSVYSDAVLQEKNVSEAFSRQSPVFDELDKHNPIIQWMRGKIHNHVLQLWKKGDSILELNAGTGIDAVFFAEQGFTVLATDNAEGMIDALNRKAAHLNLSDKLKVQKNSFMELDKLDNQQFDHVFSNFGGLNCTDKLGEVINSFDKILKPGGTATLVLMPKVCPWELALALKGNFKVAFRRLKKGGTPSHLEGKEFMTYYYSPQTVRRMFGRNYSLVKIEGLGITVPPPYLENFAIKHPRIYKMLSSIEGSISSIPPFRSWADHFVITVRKNG